MNRYQLRTAWLLVAGLFISLSTQAQKIELGASLGGMLYKGDVAPALNPRFFSPAVGGFFRYNISRSFSLRAGGAIGAFKAEDQFSKDPLQQARNYSFRTTINELSVDVAYNFLNYKSSPKATNWSPYVFAGIGLCKFSNDVIRTGGVVMYPLGIGVKYEIKRPWSIGFEFGTRFTRHDYLDGLADMTLAQPRPKPRRATLRSLIATRIRR